MLKDLANPVSEAPEIYLAEVFAAFSAGLTFEAIPTKVLEKAKLLILDTIGVALGAAADDSAAMATAAAAVLGETGTATVLGQKRSFSPHAAAFANGSLAHAFDFDDTHIETLLHPSCVLVPALLAAAEANNTSGKDALVAFVAGTEVTLRLAQMARQQLNRRGFQTSAVAGSFGAALIAARCAALSEAETTNVIGLAGSVAPSGIMQCVPAGASAKQMHPGWTAHCGLMALDLHKAGFTGPSSIFEGPLGVFNAFLNGIEPEAFKGPLGSHWELLAIRSKLYPCGHPIHANLDCALEYVRTHGSDPDKIEKIELAVPEGAIHTVCEPWEKKKTPATAYDTRFSLPYAVAVTLMSGQAGVDAFSEKYLDAPQLPDWTRLLEYRVEPSLQIGKMPAQMTVFHKDGTEWSHTVAEVRGGLATPIPADDLFRKFRDLTRAYDVTSMRQVETLVAEMDRQSNLSDLMQLMR